MSSFIASLLAGAQRAHRLRRRRGDEPARARDRHLEREAARRDRARASDRKLKPAGARARRSVGTDRRLLREEVRLRAPARRWSRSPATTRAAWSAWAPTRPAPRSSAWAPATRCSPRWPRPRTDPQRLRQRVRQPGRRLHGALLLRQRLAGPRGGRQAASASDWDDVRARHPRADAARQRRQHAAPLLRPGDHAPAAGPGAALVRQRRASWPGKDADGGGPRRGRGAGAVDAPPLRLHRRDDRHASWSPAARRKNAGILRVLADVFQAEIVPLRVGELVGAGRRAARGAGRRGPGLGATSTRRSPPRTRRDASAPDPATKVTYEELIAQLRDATHGRCWHETPAKR